MSEHHADRPGPVIWITGLSGAGKSTVAAELIRRARAMDRHPVLLDGDEMRGVLGATRAHDSAARRDLALLYGRMCGLLSGQGHTVVCATISLCHEAHAWNRANLPGYVEILLDVPLRELRRRDPKGIYASADDRDRTVGVGIDAEFPLAPDLVIPNFGAADARTSASRILDLCLNKGVWT
ncbi:adenylyl-sulfate kinase [Streptomyces sp. DT171]|uniref:adenylyl-sulfate kinase n=1 Tax=Streptomyces sp. DT171 TaxID=3416524 RepID=UPI003CF314D8